MGYGGIRNGKERREMDGWNLTASLMRNVIRRSTRAHCDALLSHLTEIGLTSEKSGSVIGRAPLLFVYVSFRFILVRKSDDSGESNRVRRHESKSPTTDLHRKIDPISRQKVRHGCI